MEEVKNEDKDIALKEAQRAYDLADQAMENTKRSGKLSIIAMGITIVFATVLGWTMLNNTSALANLTRDKKIEISYMDRLDKSLIELQSRVESLELNSTKDLKDEIGALKEHINSIKEMIGNKE